MSELYIPVSSVNTAAMKWSHLPALAGTGPCRWIKAPAPLNMADTIIVPGRIDSLFTVQLS